MLRIEDLQMEIAEEVILQHIDLQILPGDFLKEDLLSGCHS